METTHIIAYRTQWGEHIEVMAVGAGAVHTLRMPLTTNDGYHWSGTLRWEGIPDEMEYTYCVCDECGNILRTEQGLTRRWIPRMRQRVVFCDTWMDAPGQSVFERSALSECTLLRRGAAPVQTELLDTRHMLLLTALPPLQGWRWGVLGSSASLGAWHPERVRLMNRTGVYEWGLPLTVEDVQGDTTYKYVWVSEGDGRHIVWEQGEDHCLMPPACCDILQPLSPLPPVVRRDHFPDMRGCGVDVRPRMAGVVMPVFSLRSAESFGIGDFGDLRKFVEWAAGVGMSAVQILPINDTTTTGGPRDSYPYSAISVYALHPIYFDPQTIRDSIAYSRCEAEGRRLNALDSLDYEAVYRLKNTLLRDFYVERGDIVERSQAFRTFCHDNAHWIKAYADFCAMRDYFHTADFRSWPASDSLDAATKHQIQADCAFHIFVQYLLHNQLLAVRTTARRLGVILKGDIPIGICRDSVPAREDAHLFHFDGSAGAPPDAFATQGQNWGFPTYDWERMAEDGYAWWKRRLRHTSQYFDAYRIDHVLGFFRIWEVPASQVYGTLGHFRPSLPMAEDEIRSFGFTDFPLRYTTPLLGDSTVHHIAGLCAAARSNPDDFIYQDTNGDWRLLPEWHSQRNISDRVWDSALRQALMDAVTEVLFIVDSDTPSAYHPRVCGQLTEVYHLLDDVHRQAFDRLHEHYFYHRHNDFWADEALRKMPAVIGYSDDADVSSNPAPLLRGRRSMLPCAEDLGMVPASVGRVLRELQVLSLEIERMPKVWGMQFADVVHYPYMSVATPGTHDMSPFRLWWREDANQTQAYWRDVLHREGTAPADVPVDVQQEMVSRHLDSPSMLCLISLQDLLGMDSTLRHPHPEAEQINCPSDPNHYWRYRMHLTIEQLSAHTPFNELLRSLIKRSGRGVASL